MPLLVAAPRRFHFRIESLPLSSFRDPLFSIVSHRLQTLPYSYLSPGYHPLLFFPPSTSALSFFLFPLPFSSFFHLRPLRRLAINHGAVHERCCSRSNDSLSLSLFPGFLLLPVVAIYFTSLRRYRKLFAALDPARQTPEGSIVPSRESKNLARSTPTRLFSPMVIYGPLRRARGKKKRYSNNHASSIEFDVYLILFIL